MTDRPRHAEDEQRRIAELIRSFDAPAPQSLHRQVEALVASHEERHAARRISRRLLSPGALAGVGVALAAAVAVAIAGGLGGGGSRHTVSFGQVASQTLRAATLPTPPESHAQYAQLDLAVDGVPFPYWSERFGWRSTGSREDRVDGRLITTVFYANSRGQRIGYVILAGTAVPAVTGGVIARRGGVPYRILTQAGASVVTWLHDGHLCVVSGRGISSATLLRLASWSGGDVSAS